MLFLCTYIACIYDNNSIWDIILFFLFGGLVVAGVERQKKELCEIICFTVDWLLNF